MVVVVALFVSSRHANEHLVVDAGAVVVDALPEMSDIVVAIEADAGTAAPVVDAGVEAVVVPSMRATSTST